MRLPEESARRSAFEGLLKWVLGIGAEFDAVFDSLVAVRREMALSAGEESFTHLAYRQARRFDWDPARAADFRQALAERIVPLAMELRAERCRILGKRLMQPWDAGCLVVHFPLARSTGARNLRLLAETMFSALDSRLGEFFRRLDSQGRLDLGPSHQKQPSAFCALFPDSGESLVSLSPGEDFTDVFSLAHEVGHAFAFEMARNHEPFEFKLPGRDVMEVHSVTLEHLAMASAERALPGEQASALRNIRLLQTLEQLPFLALSDAFHHHLYECPEARTTSFDGIWARLEARYQPGVDFSDVEEARFLIARL